jgi:hypothetical protein
MSPLGSYPIRSIVLDNAAYIMSPDICFSIIRIKENPALQELSKSRSSSSMGELFAIEFECERLHHNQNSYCKLKCAITEDA